MYVGFYQGFPELLSFRSFSQIWVLLRFFEIAMIASFTVRFRVIEEKTWQSTEKTTTGNNWSQSWKPRMRSWNPSTSVRQYAAVTEFLGWHRMTRIAFAFRIPSCFCVILCLVCLIWINLVGHVMNVVALVPRVPFFQGGSLMQSWFWCVPDPKFDKQIVLGRTQNVKDQRTQTTDSYRRSWQRTWPRNAWAMKRASGIPAAIVELPRVYWRWIPPTLKLNACSWNEILLLIVNNKSCSLLYISCKYHASDTRSGYSGWPWGLFIAEFSSVPIPEDYNQWAKFCCFHKTIRGVFKKTGIYQDLLLFIKWIGPALSTYLSFRSYEVWSLIESLKSLHIF
jgi:hypothetical protein